MSPILFVIYIDDLRQYCERTEDNEVQTDGVGKAEILLTADDVILHKRKWTEL